nr:MAG TPA: hypothetical protein [Caudoviricetes sp.]
MVRLFGSFNLLCNKRNPSSTDDRHSLIVLHGITRYRFCDWNMEKI